MSSKGGAETYRLTTPVLIVSWRFTDDRSAYPAIVNVLVDRMPPKPNRTRPLNPTPCKADSRFGSTTNLTYKLNFFPTPISHAKKKKNRGTIQVYVAR